MKRLFSLIFYTIVLLINATAFADKKHSLGESLDQSIAIEEDSSTDKPEKMFEYDLTPMKKPKMERSFKKQLHPSIFTKNYSFSPHLGVGYSSEELQYYSLGFHYMNFKTEWPLEYSLDINNKGEGNFSIAYKSFFVDKSPWQNHARIGLNLYMDPDQGFATVADIDNIGANLQYGWEKFLSPPISVRIDIDLNIGQNAAIAMLNFGYSWAH